MANTSLESAGKLRMKITHEPSGKSLITDAPVHNGGKGDSFSPVSLVEAALISCVGTILMMRAQDMGLDFSRLRLEGSHTMSESFPRHIRDVSVKVYIDVPVSNEQKLELKVACKTCPVRASLSEKTLVSVRVLWQDGTEDDL